MTGTAGFFWYSKRARPGASRHEPPWRDDGNEIRACSECFDDAAALVDRADICGRSPPGDAQHLLAARAFLVADGGGRLVGMQLNFFAVFAAHPIATPLLMLGAMMGSAFVVAKLRNSGWGVVALLGFTFLAGLFLAPILSVAAGLRNGGTLVGVAAGMTATIFFGMAAVATLSKRDFSFLGNFLWIGLLLLIVAMLANLFFQVPACKSRVVGRRRAAVLGLRTV